jgi:hypothetical protein
MADLLSRQWQLVVLKVRPDFSRRDPAIVSELVAHPDGEETTLWSREDPLEEFGLTRGTDAPSHLRLPAAFAAAVTEVLAGEAADDERPPALWLRLVPPYGYLGAVPWEDLIPMIGMPVLRVPDRLPVPVDFGPDWSAALVVCAPARATWGAEHVSNRIRALRRHLTTPLWLDVFADAHTHELVATDPDLLGGGGGGDVRLHDPADAMRAHRLRAERRAHQSGGVRAARPPLNEANLVWSDWIIEGLAGRAVRALHLAAPGDLERDRPVVTFSPDPARTAGGRWATATDDELCLLANVLGAPLVTFASPPSRHSDLAIRLLADGIGQSRPGPTVYSAMRDDPTCDALASAEAFVAASSRTATVPRHRSLFGYIQPESVHGDLTQGWSPAAERTVYGTTTAPDWVLGGSAEHPWGETAPPDRGLAPDGEVAPDGEAAPGGGAAAPGSEAAVPSWVASSARFVDTQRAALMSTAQTPGDPAPTKRAYDQGVASALEEIQELVVRHRAGDRS